MTKNSKYSIFMRWNGDKGMTTLTTAIMCGQLTYIALMLTAIYWRMK